MAKKQAKNKSSENQQLSKAFWAGFFWPARLLWRVVKFIGKGFAWIGHRPPLKQVGHAFRWFFRLRAVRFIGRILGFRYINASWQELRLVTWPAKREGLRLMGAVIIFSITFGILIAIVDYGLDKIFKQILLN